MGDRQHSSLRWLKLPFTAPFHLVLSTLLSIKAKEFRMDADYRFPIPYASIQGADVFPLTLTGMEHFWLWDDSKDYPKRFRVALQFVGNIDWDAWSESLRQAVARHPMLVAHLKKGRKLQWSIPEAPEILVCWGKGDFGTSPFSNHLDLTREAGLRIWGRVVDESHPDANSTSSGDEKQSRYFFVIECHHAVSDGLGLRQCVGEWIILYDKLTTKGEAKAKLVTMDPARLGDRGLIKRAPPTADSRPPSPMESLKLSWSFLSLSPKSLASKFTASKYRTSKSSASNFPSATPRPHHHRVRILSREETDCVLNPDGLGLANFNDLAVATMLKTVDSWNREFNKAMHPGKGTAVERFRIMIPADLRSIHDMRMPAANRLGFGFVVADSKTCEHRELLVEKVYDQTQGLRQFGLGWDFPALLNFVSRLPKLAQWLPRLPINGATAVVTNLGDLTRRHRRQLAMMEDLYPRCGDLKLEAVFCVPPIRSKTSIGIGLCRCGDTLAIGMILDGKLFDEKDADQLIDIYSKTMVAMSKA